MADDPTRSVDACKQMTQELESEIRRIRTEIQTADSRKQLQLLADELRKALWRMDDLDRELHVHDLHASVPLFFQF
jgi:Skp family chaperone for outer membrane proteins